VRNIAFEVLKMRGPNLVFWFNARMTNMLIAVYPTISEVEWLTASLAR
jgi:hypothetical protein